MGAQVMMDEEHFCWSLCCDLGPHGCICGNDCEPDSVSDAAPRS